MCHMRLVPNPTDWRGSIMRFFRGEDLTARDTVRVIISIISVPTTIMAVAGLSSIL